MPECVYHLVDLSDYRDEELRGAVVMHTALLALKYIKIHFSERVAGADLAQLEVWGNEFWRPGP